MKEPKKLVVRKKYSATGTVLGHCWGGGKAYYPTVPLSDFASLKALKDEAKKKLKDNTLDSGMGFEALKGAVLTVKTRYIVCLEGQDFHRDEYSDITIGKLTEKEESFIWESN
jgi:hypothetical protein